VIGARRFAIVTVRLAQDKFIVTLGYGVTVQSYRAQDYVRRLDV
jgi:prefoldin subunit 5